MDRLIRARVLVAEVEALGLSVDDLIAAAAGAEPECSSGPTVAENVERIAPTLTEGTLQTYSSYWKLLVARFGDHPVDQVGYDGCELVVADAERRARQARGSDGRGARKICVAALRAFFKRCCAGEARHAEPGPGDRQAAAPAEPTARPRCRRAG